MAKKTKKATKETNKSELVREALAAGKTKPSDASAYIKEKHGLDVPPSYVSTIKTQQANREKKAKRPAKATVKATGASPDGAAALVKILEGLVKEYSADKIKKALDFVEGF